MVVFKVVAYGRWSLTRSGRYERVDCIRKEHDKKCLLAKNQHLIAIWGRDISCYAPMTPYKSF